MFMLAGYLKMTVGELEQRMDSRELSEWLAVHRFFMPLDNSWAQTAMLVNAMLAPYSKKDSLPPASSWIPLEKTPQHPLQAKEELLKMQQSLFG